MIILTQYVDDVLIR